MLDDKDVDGVSAALAPVIDSWVALAADSPRALPASELARRIAKEPDVAPEQEYRQYAERQRSKHYRA